MDIVTIIMLVALYMFGVFLGGVLGINLYVIHEKKKKLMQMEEVNSKKNIDILERVTLV